MAKIGIFGGTFDPIHFGHLITAQNVYEQRELDKIVFIPCFVSPHKLGLYSTEPKHRLNMVKLATEDTPHFEASDYEINKGNVSYTLDTVKYFKSLGHDIELIIGYDNLLVFDKWKEPDSILETAKVLVLKRNPDKSRGSVNRFFEKVIFLDTPLLEISSTNIRERIQKGLSIDFLLPEKVKRYIEENKIYKF